MCLSATYVVEYTRGSRAGKAFRPRWAALPDVAAPPVGDRYRGCLVGAAVGDALGAPVEFMTYREIVGRFGPQGVTAMESSHHVPAGAFLPGSVTDDTQLTLATARACLAALGPGGDGDLIAAAWRQYVAWCRSQDEPRLRRGPGATCLAALAGDVPPPGGMARNDSKGCGAVMRMAPVGLALPPGGAFTAGAALGRLTHGHPSGYLSAAVLADVVSRIVRGTGPVTAIDETLAMLTHEAGHDETTAAVRRAVAQAGADAAASGAPAAVTHQVAALGAGWVGEEALAIAVYCTLLFGADWRVAVLAAVNHGGDSDSTGCIAGALGGASVGLAAMPKEWVDMVEGGAELVALADELVEVAQCV
jgi:ADP-ribosyl-[dinitrogen reductase] hydrolase